MTNPEKLAEIDPQPECCLTCYGNVDATTGRCRGSACVAPDKIEEWCFRGLILMAGDGGGPRIKGGVLGLEELERFAARVRAEMPDALIFAHEYGLRAVWSDGGGRGPRMDWSDWE